MGHDIYGFNKAGKEVAYARFNMGNYNATILYSLLDANNNYAGLSGSGDSATFTIQQIENALLNYKQHYDHGNSLSLPWDIKQISNFLLNCLATAKQEGSVEVYFG